MIKLRKRKKKKTIGSKSIICIATIASLSLMGIGYASWNDGLTVNMEMKTGHIKRCINIENLEYNGLEYTLSDDGMTLNISGEVYPDFKDDMLIEIEDIGSIPTTLNSVDELNTTDIIDFTDQGEDLYNPSYLMDKDEVDKFLFTINTEEIDESDFFEEISTLCIEEEDDSIQSKIEKVEQEINSIQDEIDRLLNLKENHNFKYNLNFEQGL